MSITMNANMGRKGKRGPSSPSASTHSPPVVTSPLPKIKLNIRPTTTQQLTRPSSASSRSRSASKDQRRGVFSDDDDDDSSDLTPAEDEDEDDDDDTDDYAQQAVPRKARKRESLPNATPSSAKGIAKATPPSTKADSRVNMRPHGPSGRDRKRAIKLGEVARRRARDDKFGFGGDRFSGATPTRSHISNPLLDSDSTSSYGDDESEREMAQSLVDGDETEDEFMGGLHEAFAGQDIEDLAYGAGHPDRSMEEDAEMEWWNEEEEEDDEEFIASLTGSDIDRLQSQSSVHASSDDPMDDSTTDDEGNDTLDEFGFPAPFASNADPSSGDQPLILMENWDGQFVLVQPRTERSRSRRRGDSGSHTAGSVGGSTSISAGEQQLIVDEDANESDSSSDGWSGVDDEADGGDTTDSMAEEDMPVLDSPALDQIIGQQIAQGQFDLSMLPHPNPFVMEALDVSSNPSIVITDVGADTPALSTSSSCTSAPTPTPTALPSAMPMPAAPVTAPLPTPPMPVLPQTVPSTPVTAGPVMGTFIPNNDPCESAVIDGSGATTKSPFTRRRRHKSSDSGSTTSKRRSSFEPFPPSVKKVRYSSIPGHPRYIAARRRAAQSLVDPLDRESTPSEDEENAFSLEDMLDSSMLPDMDAGSTSTQNQHLFRFDKVPVSMYMRRNFSSASRNRTAPSTPTQGTFSFSTPASRTPNVGGVGLSGTLAGPLSHPASRMLISPLLQPTEEPQALSRKEKRRARKGLPPNNMRPLQI